LAASTGIGVTVAAGGIAEGAGVGGWLFKRTIAIACQEPISATITTPAVMMICFQISVFSWTDASSGIFFFAAIFPFFRYPINVRAKIPII
jgi:hypothetical protein